MYQVLISGTFQKQFKSIPERYKDRIRMGLEELGADPFTPRPKADIKPLKNTDPKKHRLRVGDYRIVYLVEEKNVKIIEIFTRGRGYRE